MNNVERTLLSMAIEVVKSHNGKNEFMSYEEALARYKGGVAVAKAIGMSDEKIAEIEKEAKREFYGE